MIFPKFDWTEYDGIIEKIGNHINLSTQKTKDLYHSLSFLIELGFVKNVSNSLTQNKIELSETGKYYFIKRYCANQEDESNEILRHSLEDHKAVKLILQVLWGNPKITKENIKNLLCYHKIIENNSNIGSFLSILNRFGIITYSKKQNKIKINSEPLEISNKKDYFIVKEKPYSNLLKIKKMIQEADGNIFWLEKHFSPKIYELLSFYADGNCIKEIKILTGTEHIDDSTKSEFKRLKEELENKGINIFHKIITDKDTLNGIHGRWFKTNNYIYSILQIIIFVHF